MWSNREIISAIQMGLSAESDRIESEQAVYGLDALDELALHLLLGTALEKAGFGVHREERYPEYRRSRTRSKGRRCDLVLTRDGRPLAKPEQLPTLFDPPDPVPLNEAFWLEVKIVAQFRLGGSNRRYSSAFAPIRRDIAKLAKHKGFSYGGLLILMFAQERLVADHDLELWRFQCNEQGFPLGEASLRDIALGDRLGNKICRVGLYPVCREENNIPNESASGIGACGHECVPRDHSR
jgi:hypothetical protein